MVTGQSVTTSTARYQGAQVNPITIGGQSMLIVNGKPVYGTVKNGTFVPGGQGNATLQQLAFGKTSGSQIAALGSQAAAAVAKAMTGSQIISVQGQAHTIQQGGKAKTGSGQQITTTTIDGKTYANIGGKLFEGTVSNGTFKPTGQVNNQGQVVDSNGRPVRGAGSAFLGTLATAAATGGAIGASMGGPLGAALGAVVGAGGGVLASLLTGSGQPPSGGNSKPIVTKPDKNGNITVNGTSLKVGTVYQDPKTGQKYQVTPNGVQQCSGRSGRSLGGGCTGTPVMGNAAQLTALAAIAGMQAFMGPPQPAQPPPASPQNVNIGNVLYDMTQSFLQAQHTNHAVSFAVGAAQALYNTNPFQGYNPQQLDQIYRNRYMNTLATNIDYLTASQQQQQIANSIFAGISPQVYAAQHNIQNSPELQQQFSSIGQQFGLQYPMTGVAPTINFPELVPSTSQTGGGGGERR